MEHQCPDGAAEPARNVGKKYALILLAGALWSGSLLAQSPSPLPPPSYDNSVYVFISAPGFAGDDATFKSNADAILQRIPGGPYGRVGMSGFLTVDMDWNANLVLPVLSSPNASFLSSILARAQTRGLPVHMGTIAGISRWPSIYDPAKLEDRRNCQWYMDGSLLKSGQSFSSDAWMTPSRYARKLRRHLETKIRLYAQMLISLRQSYPDTLAIASGDGEMELNSGQLDNNVSYQNQIIADYSPFAILEFRDWIQQAGLYAPGQIYAGQGYGQGGAIYQGSVGLANFNQDFGTAFSTWSLKYFDWSLSDPIDGDPGAIPAATYNGPGWTPLPTSGPGYIPGGFVAPRGWNASPFWQLWLTFRQAMIAHYVQDFASWVTTTAGAGGAKFEPSRWYSHQIPADYLNDTFPGCPNPERRLLTSASPMQSGIVGNAGSLGLTCFDVWDTVEYHRTSRYLYDDIAKLNLPNWGLIEYSPSWTLGVLDNDVSSIASQILRAYNAGAHVLSYQPWEHFRDTKNPEAFAQFLSQVKGQPRDSAVVEYLPPQVQGLSWSWFSSTISLVWQNQIFNDVANLAWSDWPAFDHFEIWRGPAPDFSMADAELIRSTPIPQATGIVPDQVKTYYRVLAVSRTGKSGTFSQAVLPLGPGGSSFYTLTPCRVADTRNPNGPLGGPPLGAAESRIFSLTGVCDIPSMAKAVSVNVTIVRPAAPGFLRFFPGDATPPLASTINFRPGAVRANNAVLPISAAGELGVENGSAGNVDLVIDVNGYFQ